MNQDEFYTKILDRLDKVIALQLTMAGGRQAASLTDRILLADELGLAPAEIGRLVARKANYVSAVLGSRRSSKPEKTNG